MIAEAFTTLITDPNHIAFELTLEAVTGIVVYPLARRLWHRALRRHDKVVHGPKAEDQCHCQRGRAHP